MKKLHIIHGWTYSLDKWTEITTQLEAAGIEPVMHYVPGLSAPSDEVWDVQKYVAWLKDELADEKDVVLIGHSNGGRIGMAYDVAHPGVLQHLILLDSAGVPREDTKTSWKRNIARPIAALLKPIMPTKLRRRLYQLIGASDYGNATPNMRETMKNLLENDKVFDPSGVTVPTTLIWGDLDRATPLENGYLLQQKIPNADELHVIPGAGHSPQGTNPDQVAKIIIDTLGAR